MIVLGGLTLLAWLWLLVGHGRFWRTDQRLPELGEPDHWPSVAVVVPARDEASMLPVTLPTLLAQRYPGQARVIVVDDNSTDGTGTVAKELSGLLPLIVTSPGEPPAGWTGKLWAVAHGVAEAGDVDLLLLTDADITHDPDSLTRLVSARRDLVSQMALLRAETRWERLIVPAFVYFFAMLFPFRWVNKPGARTAASAGGCVLVRRSALTDAGGIPAIRDSVIDDVALAGLIKRAGGRIWLGLSASVRSVRHYPRLGDLWRMIARSAYTQLRHSPLLLAGTVVGMFLVFLAPVVVTVSVFWSPWWWLGALAWLIMAGTFVPMLRLYRIPAATAFLLPLTGFLYTLMTLDSGRRYYFGRGAVWKGREYGAP